eukprot:3420104-Alexandrium_andersonii.AAC.1
MLWLFEHAGEPLTKHLVGHDGRTGFERLFREALPRGRVRVWGARVLPGAAGGDGPQLEPSLGVWHLARPALGYCLPHRGSEPER